MNEPESGGASGLAGETGTRWTFVKHFVGYFQSKTKTPTTVGVGNVNSLAVIGKYVDVLTFHSYHATWEQGLQRTDEALYQARTLQKPVFNSETGCIARSNAFDQTMEMAIRNGIGFSVWELMISDCLDCIDTRRWKHGLMYTDGTTRDPSAIAALHGVFLNRGDAVGIAVARPDVEGAVSRAVSDGKKWLAGGAAASFQAGIAAVDSLGEPPPPPPPHRPPRPPRPPRPRPPHPRLVHASRVVQVEELGAGDGDGVAPDWGPRPVVLVLGVIDVECPLA